MFEQWASDFIASYLGRFIDLQPEKLRISLWNGTKLLQQPIASVPHLAFLFSAWRTGLSLENVNLLPHAFNQLGLPFQIETGVVGHVQAIMPWKALKSPVIVELSDVTLRLIPLDVSGTLNPEVAVMHALTAKRAAAAIEELKMKEVPPSSKGMLWSLLQQAITTLVNRLQLLIRNVKIQYHDPNSGREIVFNLDLLKTCLPDEAEHATALATSQYPEGFTPKIEKQVLVQGLSVEWMPPILQRSPNEEYCMVQPTQFSVHVASNSGGLIVHGAATLHELSIAITPAQTADVVSFLDEIEWLKVKLRYLAIRPPQSCLKQSSKTREGYRHFWRYAVDAVLSDLRGDGVKGLRCWKDAECLRRSRSRYVMLYRKQIEGALTSTSEKQLDELEIELPVEAIISCRCTARASILPQVEDGSSQKSSKRQKFGPAASTDQKGLIARSIARAGATLGYAASQTGKEVPQPSEADVDELLKAVDFKLDEQETVTAIESTFKVTMDALIGRVSISLQDAASLTVERLRFSLAGRDFTSETNLTVDGIKLVGRDNQVLVSNEAQTEEATSCGRVAPLLRLKMYQSREDGPRLDVLVRPIVVELLIPNQLASLSAFIPATNPESHKAAIMRATNALSKEARAMLKAQYVQRLGPCIDLLVKFEDINIILGMGGIRKCAHLSVHTGALLLTTTKQQGGFADAQAGLELLSAIENRRKKNCHQIIDTTNAIEMAVAKVEDHLVYHHLNLSMAALQVQFIDDSAQTLRVVTPLALGGRLKMHRIAEDFGVPQICCSLQFDPLIVDMTAAVLSALKHLSSMDQQMENGTEDQVTVTELPRICAKMPLVLMDISFSSIESTVDDVHMVVQGAEVAVQGDVDGAFVLGMTLNGAALLDRIVGDSNLPPPIVGSTLPHVAQKLSLDAVSVSFCKYPSTSTTWTMIDLVGIRMDGFLGEAGNFVHTSTEHSVARAKITIFKSPIQNRTDILLKNVLIGHATMLRMVTLLTKQPSQHVKQQPVGGSSAMTCIELRNCRMVWKHQPELEHTAGLSGTLCDFLCVHDDILLLDIPHMLLTLPLHGPAVKPHSFLLQNEINTRRGKFKKVFASVKATADGHSEVALMHNVSLHMATMGLASHPSLPIVSIPKAHILQSTPAGGAYHVSVEAVNIGVHPSHIAIVSALMQFYAMELDLLKREVGTDVPSKVGEDDTSSISPSSPVAAARSRDGDGDVEENGRRAKEPHSKKCWNLKASVDALTCSVLGASGSSVSLKLEWLGTRVQAVSTSENGCSGTATFEKVVLYGLLPKSLQQLPTCFASLEDSSAQHNYPGSPVGAGDEIPSFSKQYLKSEFSKDGFYDALPTLSRSLHRSSGPSAVSRYYSAMTFSPHGSDMEEEESEWAEAEGIESPPGELKKTPIPLALENPRYESVILLKVRGPTACAPTELALKGSMLTVNCVHVRMFLYGWVESFDCLRLYAVLANESGILFREDTPTTGNDDGGTAKDRPALKFEIQKFCYDVVGSYGRLSSKSEETYLPIPLCSLSTSLTATFGNDGMSLHMHSPGTLLSIGVVYGEDIVTDVFDTTDSDAFVGLKDLRISLDYEEHCFKYAVSIHKLSVWTHPCMLCVMAHLGQQASCLMLAVQDHLKDLGAHKLSKKSEPSVVSSPSLPGNAVQKHVKLSIEQLAVYVGLLDHAETHVVTTVPLAEVVIHSLGMSVSMEQGGEKAFGTTHFQLFGNVYSSKRQGWEPIIEPWSCHVEYSSKGSTANSPSLHQKVVVSSRKGLELTMTDSISGFLTAVDSLVPSITRALENPHDLSTSLQECSREVSSIIGAAKHQICNVSGISLDVWVVSSTDIDGLTSLKPIKTIPSGSTTAISVVNIDSLHTLGSKYAEQPSAESGVINKVDGRGGNSSTELLRSILYLRAHVPGATLSGPVYLNKPSTVVYTINNASTTVPSTTKVVCESAPNADNLGGTFTTVHSGIKIVNNAYTEIDVGVQTPMGMVVEPHALGTMKSGESLWLPALGSEGALLCLRPKLVLPEIPVDGDRSGVGARRASLQTPPGLLYASGRLSPARSFENIKDSYDWSAAVPLQHFVKTSSVAEPKIARQLMCPPMSGVSIAPFILSMGSWLAGDTICTIEIDAPITLHNALPIPVRIILHAPGGGLSSHKLKPNQQAKVHSLDASHVDYMVLSPHGFQSSGRLNIKRLEETMPLLLKPLGHGQSKVEVALSHTINECTGGHVYRVACPFWVFNFTGLPIALRQSLDDGPVFSRLDDGRDVQVADAVPDSWIPQLEFPSGKTDESRRRAESTAAVGLRSLYYLDKTSAGIADAANSHNEVNRVSSTVDMPGLGELLGGRISERGVARLKGTDSNSGGAGGLSGSVEILPTFETPSAFPSIQGGLQLQGRRLQLQLRATQNRARPGGTYWSDSVEVDALGGAAIVTVPSPLLPPIAPLPAERAAYVFSVTASAVPNSGGARALCIVPRYLLHNTLDVPIQYKQQDTTLERELPAGGARAIRWADASRPLRLSMRVQGAGWQWSGGAILDSPGDTFVKIRHRDRGVTMLVRLDVATGPLGVLCITLSHQPAGFAPYRIENCTLETLHARQLRVREQQDVLRPYCSLNYAWDEPTRPHKLVIELPGNKLLGIFELDKVGQNVILSLHPKHGDATERSLRVVIRAEGPTRVLTIMDTAQHVSPSPPSLSPPAFQPAPKAMALPPLSNAKSEVQGGMTSGNLWEVSCEFVSIGISLVHLETEIAYLKAGAFSMSMGASAARYALSLELKHIQMDNPSSHTEFPVTIVLPAPASQLGSTVVAAVEKRRRPAVSARLAVWRRRPAGVLCVEQAELQLGSAGLFLEQKYIMTLISAIRSLSTPHLLSDGKNDDGNFWGAAELTPDAEVLLAAAAGQGPPVDISSMSLKQQLKVYIDSLFIGPLDVAVSFHPAPFDAPLNRPGAMAIQGLLSLADVEDARLSLSGLELHNPLMAISALAQHLQRHYTRAVLPELYKIVGSASVFGDPVRLFHHLGLGVWSFLASPAAGLVESARKRGIQQFLTGFVTGTKGLFENVVFALSNAAAKGAGAARKAIVVLGLESQRNWQSNLNLKLLQSSTQGYGDVLVFLPASARRKNRHHSDQGLVGAIFAGIIGLMAEPVHGFDQHGLAGLARGLQRGALGLVVLPVASLLETSAHVAHSIRRAVAGTSGVGWSRPPRQVLRSSPLPLYDRSDAMGRWLLSQISTRFDELFVACVQTRQAGYWVVVTTTRILFAQAREPMWAPGIHWEANIINLERCACVNHRSVTFLAHVQRQEELAYEKKSSPEAAGPWSFIRVECENEKEALRLQNTVLTLKKNAPARVMFVGSCQMLHM